MNEREFPFQLYCFLSCLIFSFIVVLSDDLTCICEETCNIVTLSILSEIFQGALSLTCVLYGLENHLPLCLQCTEQGFSHVHVLLKMQYLIQVLLSLSLFQPNENFKTLIIKYMQLWA